MQKKYVFLILCIFVVVTIFIWYLFFRSTGQIYYVTIQELGFTPQEIIINKGDTIEFSSKMGQQFWPASDLHPTHGIYPEFDPKEPIEPSSAWRFTFKKKGAWKYHDHLNPSYRANIIVK